MYVCIPSIYIFHIYIIYIYIYIYIHITCQVDLAVVPEQGEQAEVEAAQIAFYEEAATEGQLGDPEDVALAKD